MFARSVSIRLKPNIIATVGDGSAVVLLKRFSHELMSANFKRGAALV